MFNGNILIYLMLLFPPISSEVPHSIEGLVDDSSATALPGVVVTLQADGSSATRLFTTAIDGKYYFDCLPEGRYKLRFEIKGFLTETIEDIEYKITASMVINKRLQSNPAIWRYLPDRENRELFSVSVRDSMSALGLPDVEVMITDPSGRKSIKRTDQCGNAIWHLDPDLNYSARLSRSDYQERMNNFSMTRRPYHLDLQLTAKKKEEK